MGTLMGHALPGSFFISFSLWWLIRGLYNYYKKPGQYVNKTTMACCCGSGCFRGSPLDLWIFILLMTIGGVLEIVTSYMHVGVFITGNKQHLTMYTAFAVSAATSILVHHQWKFVTKGAEYLTFVLALTVELILFAFHLHGRDPVDVHIHMLLVYSIGGCIIATLAEFHYPHSINAALARQYMMLVQGTWFFQIGFTLYPPDGTKWDLNEMENIMIITLIYAWHLIGCLIGVLLLSALVCYCTTPRQRTSHHSADKVNLLPTHGGITGDEQSGEETELFSGQQHKPAY